MNHTLPATAAAVQTGMILIADAIKGDLVTLGYAVEAVIVTNSVQVSTGLVNRNPAPWSICAFVMIAGREQAFRADGKKIEAAFAALIKSLPALPEAKA